MTNRSVVCSNGKKFASVAEAARSMNFSFGAICRAIRFTKLHRYATCGGLQWAYADSKPRTWPQSYPVSWGVKRPVFCSNGDKFASVTAAAKAVKVARNTMSEAVLQTYLGKYRKCAGFQWSYADVKFQGWPHKKHGLGGAPRPIIRSDGREFPSIEGAARWAKQTTKIISKAVVCTSRGEYCECVGFQWAYADPKPKVWPEKEKSKIAQPVVTSNGLEFESIALASRCTKQPRAAIVKAAVYTNLGKYHTCFGYQWAFAESKPEVWPKKGSK